MESLKIAAGRRYGTQSPLRYPGGKASLAGLFSDLIPSLGLEDAIYIEPYAGGAGAAIPLLRGGFVDRVVINDIDPAVFSFWSSVVNENSRFIENVKRVPLSLDEWERQREIYRAGDQGDPFSLGFSFFYLNRTNRSGILSAGVIGGKSQAAKDKIDARFKRETLVSRISSIGELSSKITVADCDGRSIIEEYAGRDQAFFYIDPPYVKAGGRLYLNSFDSRDHAALAEVIHGSGARNWLITYDDDELIRRLYRNDFSCFLELNYSAYRVGKAMELMMASPAVASAIHSTVTWGEPIAG